METFLILFVLGLMIYLGLPEKKPSPKDPWEEMGRAIGTALKTLNAPSDGGKGGGGGGGKKDGFPWFLTLAILTGLVVYLLSP
ncbi:hypothetical protein GFS31_08610 [Leptolyngbya sp. BL0902]|uniref:hypothetical protein n=1 Tax=Leptolyngbya sp. BL0902 TaxID=1115757 RepID=UPI0018E8EFA4|nr:hypothetical protein [Leptolyngbya sp. BL0902]QQE64182.1 hypothetical protein GFS31_08610 [Leptolyngbya sp. BL0902]